MRLEAVFDASARQPAGVRAGPVPSGAGEVQSSAAVDPAAAKLGEYEPSIIHEADTARHGADPVLVYKA